MEDVELERKADETRRGLFQEALVKYLTRHCSSGFLRFPSSSEGKLRFKVRSEDVAPGLMAVFHSTEDPGRHYFSGLFEPRAVARRVLDLAECGGALDMEPAQCAVAEIRLVMSAHGSELRVGRLSKEGQYSTLMEHGGPGTINKIAQFKEPFSSNKYIITRDLGLLEIVDTKHLTVEPVLSLGMSYDLKDCVTYCTLATTFDSFNLAVAVWHSKGKDCLLFVSTMNPRHRKRHLEGQRIACVTACDHDRFLLCLRDRIAVYNRVLRQFTLSLRNPTGDTVYHCLQPLAIVDESHRYFLVKDRKAVTFVNLDDRTALKMADSPYNMAHQMPNSLLQVWKEGAWSLLSLESNGVREISVTFE